MDCSPPGSSVHGISQANILELVSISFSRESSWLLSPALQVDSLPLSHQDPNKKLTSGKTKVTSSRLCKFCQPIVKTGMFSGSSWLELVFARQLTVQHHWLKGHELEQAPEDGEGQGSLAGCSPGYHKELDTTERLKIKPTLLWIFPDLFGSHSFPFLGNSTTLTK